MYIFIFVYKVLYLPLVAPVRSLWRVGLKMYPRSTKLDGSIRVQTEFCFTSAEI